MIADPLRAAVRPRSFLRACVPAFVRNRRPPVALASVLAALLVACAVPPQGSALAARYTPSPNFDARRVVLVVLHHTGTSVSGEALQTLTRDSSQVSAHYLVERSGAIVQLVDERARAWHAGDSRWGTIDDVNSASIGIEVENDGREPYPPAQVTALLRLLADVRERHRLGPAAFVGHADVAPARKADPGVQFPWRTLAQNGFGLWCDPPYPPAPPGFDPLLGLRAIGYDTRQPEAAFAAFRLHFLPALPAGSLAEALPARDADLIHCLLQQRNSAEP
jgi:N-acetylmuramoyl-L-alanine amidase